MGLTTETGAWTSTSAVRGDTTGAVRKVTAAIPCTIPEEPKSLATMSDEPTLFALAVAVVVVVAANTLSAAEKRGRPRPTTVERAWR